jgi:hypothetical protein
MLFPVGGQLAGETGGPNPITPSVSRSLAAAARASRPRALPDTTVGKLTAPTTRTAALRKSRRERPGDRSASWRHGEALTMNRLLMESGRKRQTRRVPLLSHIFRRSTIRRCPSIIEAVVLRLLGKRFPVFVPPSQAIFHREWKAILTDRKKSRNCPRWAEVRQPAFRSPAPEEVSNAPTAQPHRPRLVGLHHA